MDSAEEKITELLSPYRREIRDFAQALRVLLKAETEPAFELAGVSAQSFNLGYSFTTTSWDSYCAIIVYRNHINLSFPSGAELLDPEGLLHGTGKRVRHLKLESLEDLEIPAARDLLLQARNHAFTKAGEPEWEQITTVIKRG